MSNPIQAFRKMNRFDCAAFLVRQARRKIKLPTVVWKRLPGALTLFITYTDNLAVLHGDHPVGDFCD